MKNDPGKYNRLIFLLMDHNTPSTANYNSQDYDTSSYGQQQQQYPSQAYTDMLLEEAEKLYNKLAKELGDELLLIMLPAYPHHHHHCCHLLKNDKVVQQQQQHSS
jgi:hypothetical protein